MPQVLRIRNRQRARAVDPRRLRAILKSLLAELLPSGQADLGVFIVAAPEMTRLNETFLHHQGSTDVITFDYGSPDDAGSLCGEIVVCLDEAILQSRRFHTTWQSEVVRYVVHGVLHLLGHDDTTPGARRRMKQAENRLHRLLAKRFSFGRLTP